MVTEIYHNYHSRRSQVSTFRSINRWIKLSITDTDRSTSLWEKRSRIFRVEILHSVRSRPKKLTETQSVICQLNNFSKALTGIKSRQLIRIRSWKPNGNVFYKTQRKTSEWTIYNLQKSSTSSMKNRINSLLEDNTSWRIQESEPVHWVQITSKKLSNSYQSLNPQMISSKLEMTSDKNLTPTMRHTSLARPKAPKW